MKKVISTVAALMFAASTILLPGCATIENFVSGDSVKQVSSIVLNGPILINDIEMLYEGLKKLQDEKKIFSDSELSVLSESMSVFNIVKTEYETLLALELIPSSEDAMVLWKQARTAFTSAMEVVDKHRDEYTSSIKVNIDVMKSHAKRADTDVMALLANPTTTNISEALKIVGGLVQIGTKVAVLL